ncbi:carboxylesterase domain protein [Mycobacterium kansasii]|uniref:Carboxylesterase domain protein n=1 Tax=Mycobacterium kansasii TaxID=1768 RepID=A0A1V3WAM8_MYCKA|nr:carboxylesterase domain protein [Mycobacterium kansasii]
MIGVDDEQYGQRLAAFVVLAPDAHLDRGAGPEALNSMCATTWPTTRCRVKSRFSTSCRAAAPANPARRTAVQGARLVRGERLLRLARRPRPLTRGAVELVTPPTDYSRSPATPTPRPGVLVRLAGIGGAGNVSERLGARRGTPRPPRRFRRAKGKTALALTVAAWAILGVIRYRGITTPGPVLEAGLSEGLGPDYAGELAALPTEPTRGPA